MLTQERLKELLYYDPDTGVFKRPKTIRGWAAGSKVGTKDSGGRILISVDGKRYFAHRLAWFYVHDFWPPDEIDHINGNQLDNRIENLRLATSSQNKWNSRPKTKRRRNGGFLKGAYYIPSTGKWRSQILKDRKAYGLGSSYLTEEEAHAAYVAKAKEFFGEFARAG
jgi:hypothetical protein